MYVHVGVVGMLGYLRMLSLKLRQTILSFFLPFSALLLYYLLVFSATVFSATFFLLLLYSLLLII